MRSSVRPLDDSSHAGFYVQPGCCTACMAPHEEAPALMGMDAATGECFFARQPADDREVYLAMKAISVAELDCLRYGGTDERILRRMARLDGRALCDHAPPADADTSPRTHVSFAAPGLASAWEVAAALAAVIGRNPRVRQTPPAADGGEVRLEFAWPGGALHPVWISADARAAGRWVVRHHAQGLAQVGVAISLDDWLRDDPRLGDLRWYTAAEWDAGGHTGSPWPF